MSRIESNLLNTKLCTSLTYLCVGRCANSYQLLSAFKIAFQFLTLPPRLSNSKSRRLCTSGGKDPKLVNQTSQSLQSISFILIALVNFTFFSFFCIFNTIVFQLLTYSCCYLVIKILCTFYLYGTN